MERMSLPLNQSTFPHLPSLQPLVLTRKISSPLSSVNRGNTFTSPLRQVALQQQRLTRERGDSVNKTMNAAANRLASPFLFDKQTSSITVNISNLLRQQPTDRGEPLPAQAGSTKQLLVPLSFSKFQLNETRQVVNKNRLLLSSSIGPAPVSAAAAAAAIAIPDQQETDQINTSILNNSQHHIFKNETARQSLTQSQKVIQSEAMSPLSPFKQLLNTSFLPPVSAPLIPFESKQQQQLGKAQLPFVQSSSASTIRNLQVSHRYLQQGQHLRSTSSSKQNQKLSSMNANSSINTSSKQTSSAALKCSFFADPRSFLVLAEDTTLTSSTTFVQSQNPLQQQLPLMTSPLKRANTILQVINSSGKHLPVINKNSPHTRLSQMIHLNLLKCYESRKSANSSINQIDNQEQSSPDSSVLFTPQRATNRLSLLPSFELTKDTNESPLPAPAAAAAAASSPSIFKRGYSVKIIESPSPLLRKKPQSCFLISDQPSKYSSNTEEQLFSQQQLQQPQLHFNFEDVLRHFQQRKYTIHHDKLKNVVFTSPYFSEFLERALRVCTSDSIQLFSNPTTHMKTSYLKEQLRTIGFLPQTMFVILENLIAYLQLYSTSRDFSAGAKPSHLNLQIVFNAVSSELKWTLLDRFTSENSLRRFASELMQFFSQDALSHKIMSLLDLSSEESVLRIVTHFLSHQQIPLSLVKELQCTVQTEVNGLTQHLSYADFFYLKYRLMYFYFQRQTTNADIDSTPFSLRVLFAGLEALEQFRFTVTRTPSLLAAFQVENALVLLRKRSPAAFSHLHQSIIVQLLNSAVSRSCLIPQAALPNLVEGNVIESLKETIEECLGSVEKSETFLLSDVQAVMKSLRVLTGKDEHFEGIMQRINPEITFEVLFEMLMVSLEEHQVYKHFSSQLVEPSNFRVFALSLVVFLFDVLAEYQQPCRLYAQDIQAMFKMFACSKLAVKEFLLHLRLVYEPHFPRAFFEDFLDTCRQKFQQIQVFE